MHTFSVLSVLAAFAPSVLSLTFKSEPIEATFDDRTTAPAAAVLNSVGTYGRLQWYGFAIDQPRHKVGSSEFTGVEVKSEPNYAGGQIDPLVGLPGISTSYEGSSVAFFDFESFWWGCSTIDVATYQQVPGWCTLEVYGYAHDVKDPVAKAVSFFFPKDDVKSMEMVEAHLPPSFHAVSRVEFNVIATKPILYLDNVKYKTYNVTSIGRGLREVINSGASSQSEFHIQVTSGGHEGAVMF